MNKNILQKNSEIQEYLVEVCKQIALGDYEKAKDLFDAPHMDGQSDLDQVLSEALSMMVLRIEAREFEMERLVAEISEAREELEKHREKLAEENQILRAKVQEQRGPQRFIGNVPSMQTLRLQAERLAFSRSTVLITGETGSGKGVLARYIHSVSPRAAKPFVDVNCAAIPASLLESELFGIESGVASGVQARMGRFEQADGGTLLLDEVGDMPLESQGKILHVIENGVVERVGGRKKIPVNVRLMAATHRNLEELVKKNLFREDLFYRLNVVRLHVPPLKDRLEDLPLLISKILGDIASEVNGAPRRASPEALQLLMRHSWPGNIRELHNVLERAALFAEGTKITTADLEPSLQAWDLAPKKTVTAMSGSSFEEKSPLTLDAAVDKHIREILALNRGNKSRAAKMLGISREGLRIKLAKGDFLD